MIRFGQTYNLYANKAYINQNQKTTKTEEAAEEEAIDTPKDTSTKQEPNIGKSEEDRQWTDPKDGEVTLAEILVKQGKPGPNATLSDIANYYTAYESLYGVKPKSEEEDDYIYDSRTVYTEASFREYGITDKNIIEQYFDDRGMQKGKFGDYQGYSLKNDIVINGIAINTIEELVEALGIQND